MPVPPPLLWVGGTLCVLFVVTTTYAQRKALRVAREELRALRIGSRPSSEAGEEKKLVVVSAEENAKKCLQNAVRGALTSGLVYVGDRLGLYVYLYAKEQQKEPYVTAKMIAKDLNLNERWVQEWLRQQAGACILNLHESAHKQANNDDDKKVILDEERYSLVPGFGVVLTENSNINGYAMYQTLPPLFRAFEQLPHCFREGGGLTYESHGRDVSEGIARHHLPFFDNLLCQQVLKDVQRGTLFSRLKEGIVVADVGCGAGGSLIAMARHFAASQFHGFELCKVAIATANEAIAKAGLSERVFMHDASKESMRQVAASVTTSGFFDFVLAFDSLHDMASPLPVLRQIRESLSPQGVLLVGDIKCFESVEENFTKLGRESCAYYYGFSCAMCLPSGLSEPDGLGLGTMGLTLTVLTQLALGCGFSSVTHCNMEAAWQHQNNNWYLMT